MVFGIAGVQFAVTIGAKLGVRRHEATAPLRTRSQDSPDSSDKDFEQSLSHRLPARWAIDCAAVARLRLEAIDFYTHVAKVIPASLGHAPDR